MSRNWLCRHMGLLFTLIFCLGFSACSSPPPARQTIPPLPKPAPVEDPAQIAWNFEPHGVRVIIRADPELNIMGQTPLALTLCLYQLKSRDIFDNKASTAQGVYSLLDCTITDPGMVASQREFIQPGEEKIVTLDRAEGAKFFAVAAGFNEIQPENAAKVTAIPIHSIKEGHIFYSTMLYEAGLMDAHISITPHTMSLTGVERVQ